MERIRLGSYFITKMFYLNFKFVPFIDLILYRISWIAWVEGMRKLGTALLASILGDLWSKLITIIGDSTPLPFELKILSMSYYWIEKEPTNWNLHCTWVTTLFGCFCKILAATEPSQKSRATQDADTRLLLQFYCGMRGSQKFFAL